MISIYTFLGQITSYKLNDLSEEQKVIVVTAIDTMIKLLNNNPGYMPFYATILVGCGGTGKSHIINILIPAVRQYTTCNDTVKVAASSGGADIDSLTGTDADLRPFFEKLH